MIKQQLIDQSLPFIVLCWGSPRLWSQHQVAVRGCEASTKWLYVSVDWQSLPFIVLCWVSPRLWSQHQVAVRLSWLTNHCPLLCCVEALGGCEASTKWLYVSVDWPITALYCVVLSLSAAVKPAPSGCTSQLTDQSLPFIVLCWVSPRLWSQHQVAVRLSWLTNHCPLLCCVESLRGCEASTKWLYVSVDWPITALYCVVLSLSAAVKPAPSGCTSQLTDQSLPFIVLCWVSPRLWSQHQVAVRLSWLTNQCPLLCCVESLRGCEASTKWLYVSVDWPITALYCVVLRLSAAVKPAPSGCTSQLTDQSLPFIVLCWVSPRLWSQHQVAVRLSWLTNHCPLLCCVESLRGCEASTKWLYVSVDWPITALYCVVLRLSAAVKPAPSGCTSQLTDQSLPFIVLCWGSPRLWSQHQVAVRLSWLTNHCPLLCCVEALRGCEASTKWLYVSVDWPITALYCVVLRLSAAVKPAPSGCTSQLTDQSLPFIVLCWGSPRLWSQHQTSVRLSRPQDQPEDGRLRGQQLL